MVGELLFTLLPFFVLFLVYFYQDKPTKSFLFAPEWAFASAILFGQTIVKFVQGVIKSVPIFQPIAERIGLIVSVIIVLGLVPSMVILALVLVSPTPPDWLGYTQIGLFTVSAIVFLLLGSVAHAQACEAQGALSSKDA